MTAQVSIDPLLYTQQDNLWLGRVFEFLQLVAPAAMHAGLRDTLADILGGYFGTSQDVRMQGLVAALHARYNLNGMIDEDLLTAILLNVAIHAVAPDQQPPASQPQPPQLMVSSDTITNSPTQPPAPSQPPKSSPQNPAAKRSRKRKPKVEPEPKPKPRLVLPWRQKDWAYVCDLCGHHSHDRPCMNRHMRIGAQRVEFKVIGADPENDPHWYGVDEAGNEYMGDIVPRTKNKEGGKRINAKAGPPCGDGIAAFGRPRRDERKVKRTARKGKAKKDEGNDEEEHNE